MLQNVPSLAGLDEAAINLLRQGVTERSATAGSVIVGEGETSNRFFVIAEGVVRVCKHFGQPNEIELARLNSGDFFGEMCILETLPRAATVQAVVDTRLYTLSSLAFHHLYEAMPSQHSILVVNIARDLSRRLRHLDELFAARH